MLELINLPETDAARIRLEAARIARLRRQITRSNALRQLDRQVIQEAAAAGLRRGAAYHRADLFLYAVKRRMAELERVQEKCMISRNIIPLRHKGAAA